MDVNGDGMVDLGELVEQMQSETMNRLLAQIDLPKGMTPREVLCMLDEDGDGNLNNHEFVKGFFRLIDNTGTFQQSCMTQLGVNDIKTKVNDFRTETVARLDELTLVLQKLSCTISGDGHACVCCGGKGCRFCDPTRIRPVEGGKAASEATQSLASSKTSYQKKVNTILPETDVTLPPAAWTLESYMTSARVDVQKPEAEDLAGCLARLEARVSRAIQVVVRNQFADCKLALGHEQNLKSIEERDPRRNGNELPYELLAVEEPAEVSVNAPKMSSSMSPTLSPEETSGTTPLGVGDSVLAKDCRPSLHL